MPRPSKVLTSKNREYYIQKYEEGCSYRELEGLAREECRERISHQAFWNFFNSKHYEQSKYKDGTTNSLEPVFDKRNVEASRTSFQLPEIEDLV